MKVMVTGGAGYIGSHTCKELVKQGHQVVVYDNLSTGHRSLVKWGDFEHGDILDAQRLRTAIYKHKVNSIIHFAAKSIVSESVTNPGYYFRNNVTGTLNILDTMKDEGVKYIVVSGSCAVYGQPEIVPISEETSKAPINVYGTSKLFMEHMLEAFALAYNFKWMSLRYFNAAGCDPDTETGEWHDPETHLIPRALMAVYYNDAKLSVFGDDYPTQDGTCIRDYIHVCDLANAHILALTHLVNGGDSEALNLGSGKGFSVKEIIDGIKKITGKSVPYIFSPRRDGDPPCLVANAKKAERLLGWKPQHSDIDYILTTAWKWFCGNQ